MVKKWKHGFVSWKVYGEDWTNRICGLIPSSKWSKVIRTECWCPWLSTFFRLHRSSGTVGTNVAWNLLIHPWICAPGTYYGWVYQCSMECKVCLTPLHLTSTGNLTLIFWSWNLFPSPCSSINSAVVVIKITNSCTRQKIAATWISIMSLSNAKLKLKLSYSENLYSMSDHCNFHDRKLVQKAEQCNSSVKHFKVVLYRWILSISNLRKKISLREI